MYALWMSIALRFNTESFSYKVLAFIMYTLMRLLWFIYLLMNQCEIPLTYNVNIIIYVMVKLYYSKVLIYLYNLIGLRMFA